MMKVIRTIYLRHKTLDEEWIFSVQGENDGWAFGILELQRSRCQFIGAITRAEMTKNLDTGEQLFMFTLEDGSQVKLNYWDYNFEMVSG